MSEDRSGYTHDASDKKLDKSAVAAEASRTAADSAGHAGHDPEKIRKHDDAGKDRLFEGRIQHDDADKASDRSRLEKDAARHHHDADEVGTISDTDVHVKRKP
jgi:hypothetical protein